MGSPVHLNNSLPCIIKQSFRFAIYYFSNCISLTGARNLFIISLFFYIAHLLSLLLWNFRWVHFIELVRANWHDEISRYVINLKRKNAYQLLQVRRGHFSRNFFPLVQGLKVQHWAIYFLIVWSLQVHGMYRGRVGCQKAVSKAAILVEMSGSARQASKNSDSVTTPSRLPSIFWNK